MKQNLFLLRFASSGYSQDYNFNQISSVSELSRMIQQQYKVEDFRIITRTGHSVNLQLQELDKTLINSTTNGIDLKKVPLFYLYDCKELTRVEEVPCPHPLDALRKKLQLRKSIRENLLSPLPLQQLQRHSVDTLYKSYVSLLDLIGTCKEIQLENGNTITMCENQRKSCDALFRNILHILNEQYPAQGSLQQSSSFFSGQQLKKREASIKEQTQAHAKCIKDKFNRDRRKLESSDKEVKTLHEVCKRETNNVYESYNKLQEMLPLPQLQAFLLVEVKKVEALIRLFEDKINTSEHIYCALMEVNNKNLGIVKEAYKMYLDLERQTREDVGNAEEERRVYFNCRLKEIHRFMEYLCLEEEAERKKCGARTNVPKIIIDYEGTTDLEYSKGEGKFSGSVGPLLQVLDQQFIVRELNRVFGATRKVVDSTVNGGVKMKNMQIILQKSSEIFNILAHRAVTKKEEAIKRDQNNILSNYSFELAQIKLSYDALKHSHQLLVSSNALLMKNYHEMKKEKEEMQAMYELKDMDRSSFSLVPSKEVVQTGNKEMKSDTTIKHYNEGAQTSKQSCAQCMLQREKRKEYEQVKKKLKNELMKQVEISQRLYDELTQSNCHKKEAEQAYFAMKNVFQEMEQQRNNCKIQIGTNTMQGGYQTQETTSRFMNSNLSQQINTIKLSKTLPQSCTGCQSLQQEINNLRVEVSRLTQELQASQCELRNIIMRPTEENQSQTQVQQQNLSCLITVDECIKMGQIVLFLPFKSGVYIAVTKQGSANYMLDLRGFNAQVQQLLRQCMFVLIVRVTTITQLQSKIASVEGSIQFMFGFEDDNAILKDYAPCLLK